MYACFHRRALVRKGNRKEVLVFGDYWLFGVLWLSAHLLGIAAAVHAMFGVRTSQGAVAWIVSLLTLPYIALPLYLVFGRNKFKGYVRSIRIRSERVREVGRGLVLLHRDFRKIMEGVAEQHRVLEELTDIPFTRGNEARLQLDGAEAYKAMFADIEAAREYVLVQFYIVHDDSVGREMSRLLRAKAATGVAVYFLYDELGCHDTPERYWQRMREAGVRARAFGTGRHNRLQINFRNHRKMVVVDGRIAHTGGINLGDEYVGKDPYFGHWRDTNLRVCGPSVLAFQLSFLADWNWATDEVPEWNWRPQATDGTSNILVLPTGPADELETCNLLYLHAIHSARKRLWIATPYFVPDQPVVQALQLAALRGVDVRVLVPEKADHWLVWLSSFSYQEETEKSGVVFYRYDQGFMHQKAMLVDDDFAVVGTANLDNRSFRLNFEISTVFNDKTFAEQVEAMLAQDFQGSRRTAPGELRRRGFWFRLTVAASRLLAPMQ